MSRIGIWVANAVLLALGCFFAASIANELAAEWLQESPSMLDSAPPVAARPERSWRERQIVLTRNLFNVSTLQPAAPAPEEDLEATKLPLTLLGTVASSNADLAWAAVEDTENRRTLVVQLNDRLLDRATVVGIERRRIVLQNGPRREELALAEEQAGATPRRPAARRPPPRRSSRAPRAERQQLQERVRRLAENRFAVPREDLEGTARNPTALFSQARIVPKYDEGQMVGVQLNAIQPGSLFEEIGIEEGDTITELNGIQISSPQQSAKVLRELTNSDQFTVRVEGVDGQERTLTYEVEE